jgi:CDP-diacylglycerol---serine O-phosphatidyltransferase
MRPFRRDKTQVRPRKLMGIHPVPTMVTLGNLLCGFGAIVLSMRAGSIPPPGLQPVDCLRYAGLLIFAAMIFDALDGKVARMTKSTSKFGMEMDSLCDVVSFGVAPAVLVKAMIDQHLKADALQFPLWDRYVWPMLAIYVCCAALRLARYNVESDSGHKSFFFGMPSPGAAGCAASLALLIIPSEHTPPQAFQAHVSQLDRMREAIYWPMLQALPFVMLVLGILMVSRVHYPHVGDRLLGGKKSFFHILVLGMVLVLIFLHHEVVLALAFNGFLLYGLLNELRCQIFPSQRPKSWDEADALALAAASSTESGANVAPTTEGAPPSPPANTNDASVK